MKGTMNIDLIGETIENENRSEIKLGPLVLPKGATINGELIAVGENDAYLHCFASGSGSYLGIFKSEDENHIYARILELNI